MTTPKSHQRRGKSFEVDLVKEIRESGLEAERLALAGSLDEGDVVATLRDGTRIVLEAKAPGAGNKIDLSGWLNEADAERANYIKARGLDPEKVKRAVVIKARGKGIKDAYVVQRLSDIL